MIEITRRRLIAGAAASSALGASWLPGSASAAEGLAGSSLRIATYGGSWRDNVEQHLCGALTKAGVKLDFVIGNPEANLAKVIAAARQRAIPFDVMDGSPLFFKQMVDAGLLEKIDYANVPAAKATPDWVVQGYQIEPNWTPDCVVYDPAKFREAGIKPPERYSDLIHPKLKGKIAYPAPAHVQHWGVTVALARENGGGEANLGAALEPIRQMAPGSYYTSSVDLAGRIGSGEVWAAPWAGSWGVRMKEGGSDVAVAYMKIGEHRGVLWPATKMILKGTPNKRAAEMYLDAYLDDASAYDFCAAVGQVPFSASARRRMAADPLRKAFLPLEDAQLESALRLEWDKIDDRKWREDWNRGIR